MGSLVRSDVTDCSPARQVVLTTIMTDLPPSNLTGLCFVSQLNFGSPAGPEVFTETTAVTLCPSRPAGPHRAAQSSGEDNLTELELVKAMESFDDNSASASFTKQPDSVTAVSNNEENLTEFVKAFDSFDDNSASASFTKKRTQ